MSGYHSQVWNVRGMTNENTKATMAENRRCMIKIIESLQYLGRQGVALQRNTAKDSNFIQLLELHGKDDPMFLKWLNKKVDIHSSHDMISKMKSCALCLTKLFVIYFKISDITSSL